MQFNFLISKCMSVNENGMTILNGTPQRNPCLDEVITTMGEASAKAQNLKQVITSPSRFYQTDQKLYIKSEGKQCLGILKIGKKNLFHRDLSGLIKEIQPLCVLDFYVHESVQRRGIGKELFEEMLRCENIMPEKIAYDRPSPKLLGFLKKHYHLSNYIPQNNNFVIFSQYFENRQQNGNQKLASQTSYYQNTVTPQKMEQLGSLMQQMTISSTKPKNQSQQQIKSQAPWGTDQKSQSNMYQTTTGLMSAQIQKKI
ncbi:unnamed protein product (macronuclear) [Paramecium tetraurelia]|uniref:Alpha-tubulin N-acetyltransferase n=1 Tax=Paramecium tetraurelia TaxID=5888 RepID=A0CAA9_PARTE|nr:uncharacterized protein GSPATT00036506001 [Paramecium tetraurelia]CAK67726.1 unnamed protein product [Paramecium tetraurelia]|eukprot:XP_001435123.1 hypothetical protein (macronuclear) [Paramecium tetraurelia strain d4-2]